MNNLEDTNEDIDNLNEEDTIDDEDENVDSQSYLKEKKRTINKLNAKNNIGQEQFFINNVDTIVYKSCKQFSEESNLEESLKKYDLCNLNDCSEFIEKYKYSEYLAMAIILGTFEAVLLGDLPDLQKTLMEYLPTVEVRNSEVKEEFCSQPNPYVSLNTILAVISGKQFVTEDGQTCIGLGEKSKKVLINILNQFPILRSAIISWLIYLNKIYEYRTAFDAYQIATAFARIVSMDIRDAKMRIFPKLYSNPNNAGLLGTLIYKLYIDNISSDNIAQILFQWTESDSRWIWKSACLAYSLIMEKKNGVVFEENLNETIGKRIIYLKQNDLHFIAALLYQSKHCRTMFSKAFGDAFSKTKDKNRKLLITGKYINLVRYCYYMVNESFMELPLVACDSKLQQMCLTEIVKQIMSVYSLRKQLYAILGVYMSEISGYKFSERVVNHISAFFYNMILSHSLYKQDIIYFLRNCENEVATQIFDRLYHICGKGIFE